jgi:hypothetical protein
MMRQAGRYQAVSNAFWVEASIGSLVIQLQNILSNVSQYHRRHTEN